MNRLTRLGDVVDINPRGIPSLALTDDISFVAMADLTEDGVLRATRLRPYSEVNAGYTPFRNGDVLLAKITPCFENGKSCLVSGMPSQYGFGSTEFHVLRSGSEVDSRFLHHLVRSSKFRDEGRRRMTGSAGQKRVPTSFIEDYIFVLPSRDEQRHIAAILDKAEVIRRRWQVLLKDADALIRSAFLQLIEGLPDRRFSIEELLSESPNAIRTGPFGSQLLHSEFTDTGVPVLGIDNVVTNRFRWAERRYVSTEKYQELRRYRVFPGDVMVTIMGTTGRVCIAPNDLPECISTKHLCTISPDSKRLMPEFLWASLLWDPVVRAQAAREGKGAIMEGWNMGIVRGLLIKLPTIGQQQAFSAFVQKVESLRIKYQTAELQANELFGSLADEAFNGQL